MTPLGSVPVWLNVGVGNPVAVAVNEPGEFTMNVVLFAFVMLGGWPTAIVMFCVAFEPTPLAAVNAIGKFPVAVGVPERVPVPFKLSTNDMPAGSAPVWLSVGAGKPVVVTVNEPAVLTTKLALFALVIAGTCLTVRVKF